MSIELKTPDGSISYKIPVAKMQNYTIDVMFKKRLLILLPFYLFVVEKSFKECEADSDKLSELLNSLQTIVKSLDALMLLGDIDELTRNFILEFSNMVNVHLARNYAMVRKGAEDIMGGKILEYEAKTIYQNGVRLGREEERYEIITNMLRDGMNIDTVARIVKMTAEQVIAIGKKAAVL